MYIYLQQYWWLLVSLLASLLVLLQFVQGANTLIFSVGHTGAERSHIIAITGRKWELTFTTLVTFGGAFFASFPLFYSTSFGGAYWVWMLLLVSFVLQAIAYEYQDKPNNFLGRGVYQCFLVFNGFVGPFVLGAAVATFFTGSYFHVDHNALGVTDGGAIASPVISQWDSAWHGLEALANIWNWVLGLAVLFLSRVLGALYLLNRNRMDKLTPRLRSQVTKNALPFLLLFIAFVVHLIGSEGLTYQPELQQFVAEPQKYWHNFMALPIVSVVFVLGVVLVLVGIAIPFLSNNKSGIWWVGTGTVFAVMSLLLVAGLNNTAYYPSLTSPQSSLCLANSCSSEFTLSVMSIVSLFIPFVLAYIIYAWWAIERKN